MIDNYAEIAARAFDEPYTGELRALVRVCGDHLEQLGDPRGTLIALAEARLDVTGRAGHDLQRALDEHVLAHHKHEIFGLDDFMYKPRAVVLEWRCGQLYGAHLDTRHLEPRVPEEPVRRLLDLRSAANLRRLTVRVRTEVEVQRVLRVLRDAGHAPPLEELFVLRQVRPRGFGGYDGFAVPMANRFPQLRAFGELDSLRPLLSDLPGPSEALAKRMRAMPAPLDEDGRTILGRGLTSREAVVREAALDRIAELGQDGAVFADLLALLIQPGLGEARLLIETLRAIGPAARRALPVLVKIPGRVKHYDRDTRRAAGTLIAALR